MSRPGFRTRLLLILIAFAVIPAAVLTTAGLVAANRVLPFIGSGGAWSRVAETGSRAIGAARAAQGTPELTAALDAHEAELRSSLDQAKRLEYLAPRVIRPVLVVVAVLLMRTLSATAYTSALVVKLIPEGLLVEVSGSTAENESVVV